MSQLATFNGFAGGVERLLGTYIYTTAGTSSLVLPANVTRIDMKAWGAGGYGVFNSLINTHGGGAAFAGASRSVSQATLSIVVGAGASGRIISAGHSLVMLGALPLLIAAAGGNAGVQNVTVPPSNGNGAPGGGLAGSDAYDGTGSNLSQAGGKGGSQSAGGVGGQDDTAPYTYSGFSGGSLVGGAPYNVGSQGGGAGGSGYYGGGGGGSKGNHANFGGGGGGSSFSDTGNFASSLVGGSNQTPGGEDADYFTYAVLGTSTKGGSGEGGSTNGSNVQGGDGLVIIKVYGS